MLQACGLTEGVAVDSCCYVTSVPAVVYLALWFRKVLQEYICGQAGAQNLSLVRGQISSISQALL